LATVAIAALGGPLSVTSAALSEVVKHAQQKYDESEPARNLQKNVTQRITQWAKAEGLDKSDVESGLDEAAWTIARYGVDSRTIADLHFDPDRAAKQVIARRRSNDSLWGTEAHYQVAERAIQITYRALIDQLEQAEPVVLPAVQALRDSIDDYATKTVALGDAFKFEIQKVVTESAVARDVSGLGNPYLGLSAYTYEDRDRFAGRAGEVERAVRMLTEPGETRPLLFVTGASGCGKSSFAQAGVQPALVAHYEERGYAVVRPVVFRPSRRPLAGLVDALARVGLPRPEEPDLNKAIGTSAGFAEYIIAKTPQQQVNLLVVDQLEELFTQAAGDEREAFIDILAGLPDFGSARTHVLATLRSDFLGDLFPHRALYDEAKLGLDLREMDEDELRECIELPLRIEAEQSVAYQGKAWEPALVAELAEQTAADATYLPLLQINLQELWRSGKLTLASYHDLGSTLTSAIRERADAVVDFVDHDRSQPQTPRRDADRRAIQDTFLALVQVSTGSTDRPNTRRRRARAELVASGAETPTDREQLLEDLVAARLLSVQREEDVDYVDIIHESLIANWDRLKDAIAEERLALQQRSRFEQMREEWLDHGRSDDYLLAGVRLAEARDLAARADVALHSPGADELLARSEARAHAEEQRQLLEEQQRREYERAVKLSDSLRLASDAREIAGDHPDLALLVSWEALLRDRNQLSETVFRESLEGLSATVDVLGRLDSSAPGETLVVTHGAIFVAAEDGVIESWSSMGAPRPKIALPGEGVTTIARLGKDGLLSYRDRTVRIHNTAGDVLSEVALLGAPPGDSSGFPSPRHLSVAADGTCLIQDGSQGWIVTTAGGMELERHLRFVGEYTDEAPFVDDEHLHDPAANLFRATLDRDGQTILTEASDGARVWNRDGTLRGILGDHTGVASSGFLSDGTIVTGRMGGRGETWNPIDLSGDVFRDDEDGGDLFIRAVDPGGEHVACTVNHTNTVAIRDATGRIQATLTGHEGHVWSAAFSADGRLVATGSADGTVRVWEWKTEAPRPVVLHGHTKTVDQVQFDPDDRAVVVSADHSGLVRRWHLASANLPPYEGHRKQLTVLRSSPVGTVSSDSQSTRVWTPNGDSVEVVGRLLDHASTADQQLILLTADGPIARRTYVAAGSELQSNRSEWALPDADENITRGVLSPDGRHALLLQGLTASLVSDDGSVGVVSGADYARVEEPHRHVVGFGFHPSGEQVALASRNGTVWIWSTETRELEHSFVADHASPDRTFDLAFDPHGEMIATAVRNEVGLWNWHGERVLRLPTAGYKVFRVEFSPDAERILTIADNPSGGRFALPQLWTREGKLVANLDVNTAVDAIPSFDPRGRFFTLSYGRGIAIVEADGRVSGTLAGPPKVSAQPRAAVAQDGETIAAAFSDGQVRIWDYASGRRSVAVRVGAVGPVEFSHDARLLLAATPAGAIDRHPLHVEDLFGAAAERVSRVLTADELRTYAIGEPMVTRAVLDTYLATT
jgi:WD40 repeat protein